MAHTRVLTSFLAAGTCVLLFAPQGTLHAAATNTAPSTTQCSTIKKGASFYDAQKSALKVWEQKNPRGKGTLQKWLENRRAFDDQQKQDRLQYVQTVIACANKKAAADTGNVRSIAPLKVISRTKAVIKNTKTKSTNVKKTPIGKKPVQPKGPTRR